MALPDDSPILLTGATGQVGGELRQSLASISHVVAASRAQMDLADTANGFRALRETIRTLKPRWIVNPAAYTAVDRAESEPELAYATNRDAVRAIGEEAARIGATVVHFSTDYVFAGAGTAPYKETDATGPMSVYGASKLAGEIALAESGAAHMIFRTSWVYGATGKNFLLTILKLAREREALRIVADQHGAPTWSRDLATMTATAIQRYEAAAMNDAAKSLNGIYHTAGAGETTWHGFAAEAVKLASEQAPGTRFAQIEAISTEEFPTAARRPANSRLDCTKLAEQFGWQMMDWRESLAQVLAEIVPA